MTEIILPPFKFDLCKERKHYSKECNTKRSELSRIIGEKKRLDLLKWRDDLMCRYIVARY